MHWNPASFWTEIKLKAGVFKWTWLSLQLGNTHHMGKMKASLICAFYVFTFIQLIDLTRNTLFMYQVSCLVFFLIEDNMVSLSCNICQPPLLSKLCCYGLGSLVMTAFTHNVCALFCKSMVVDVCLLLMYIHYEPCFRHSMSLSLSSCFAFGPIPLGQKKKKIGNKMLMSSKKIVKSDLWVKK